MASKPRSVLYRCYRYRMRRKVVVPLVISGFLFTCLEISGQLPDVGNMRLDKGRNHNNQNRHIRNVLLLASDQDSIDHSPMRSPKLKERNVNQSDGKHSTMTDWFPVGEVKGRPSAHLGRFSKHQTHNMNARFFDEGGTNVSAYNNNANNNSDKNSGNIVMNKQRYNADKSSKGRDINEHKERDTDSKHKEKDAHINKHNEKNMQISKYKEKVTDKKIGRNIINRIYNTDSSSNNVQSKNMQIGDKAKPDTGNNVTFHQQHNIFFLKVHKAASTTVHNVIMRFALSNNLDVMLPRTSNILSETGYMVNPNSLHPYPPDLKFNVVCNHIIFNKEYLSRYLKNPESTFYVGIVREPFSQFTSAFYYYLNTFRRTTLVNIALDRPENPIRGFLENPLKHVEARNYALSVSFLNNRMSTDFGFPLWNMEKDKRNNKLIQRFLRLTEERFHLVMVVDMFDESLVLLRRLLHWSVKDVLYVSSNTMDHSKQAQTLQFPWKINMNFTDEDRRLHRLYAPVDHTLYNHYRNLLLQTLKNQLPDFMEEVKMFKKILNEVTNFCKDDAFSSYPVPELTVPSNAWTEEFKVSLSDCGLIQMNELDLVNRARERQMLRYNKRV